MATITGMTADAMAAIRDSHIVSAEFDSANNLILTKFDGTQINAGAIEAATAVLAGVVELATSAETITGTDGTRVVTPAGLMSTRLVAAVSESVGPSSYPMGVSSMHLSTGSGWSLNGGLGYLITNRSDTLRAHQIFSHNAGGSQAARSWTRSYHDTNGGGGWTSWREHLLMTNLTAGSFTQLTALSSYPSGMSRLYYTTGTSGSWDFTGLAGEVVTYYDSSNNFGRQTFTQHVSGSANKPLVWSRTSDNSTGWSSWSILSDPQAWSSWTPTWSTSSGSATPSYGNAVIDCRYTKYGRKVDCKFEITFGSTTNFGSSPATTDNWLFGLPVTAARAGDQIGFVELHGSGNSAVTIGRVRTNTTGNILIGVASGPVSGTNNNTGDIDALTPITWANTNSIKGNFTYESAA